MFYAINNCLLVNLHITILDNFTSFVKYIVFFHSGTMLIICVFGLLNFRIESYR